MTNEDLDAALLAAHDAENKAEIAGLYGAAGDAAAARGQVDEACFFWTNGYIYALEAGIPLASALHGKLLAEGRDA